MNVISFKYDLSLDQTMAFEAVYSESQQLDLSQKQEIRDAPGSIFVWMFLDGELAGETYGIPLENSIAGLTDLTDGEKKSGIHCYSNTILPAFQRRGLGKILKAHWLGLAAGMGFEAVYGYARPGASQRLNAGFGAVFLRGFPNWCGTGEKYQMYRLALMAFHKNPKPHHR
jgi:GNAT superfamily N-acetyltransferase